MPHNHKLDATPRTGLIIAFPPEWAAIAPMIDQPVEHHVNGMIILAGTMAGRPVVLMQSGLSMVNAAMNAQLLLDRFTIDRILLSGIAGGVDPALSIGDVVVPERWNQYLEVALARETPEGWVVAQLPGTDDLPNFGMFFPRRIVVGNASQPVGEHRWFHADPGLLAVARSLTAGTGSLDWIGEEHRFIVGGNGISGPAFADNAEYRDYLFATYDAQVVDMESAAVAHVAFANSVPFIALRSLSDLAGGDAETNQIHSFMELASVNSARVVRRFVAALPAS